MTNGANQILVVEDNAAMSALVRFNLEKAGYEVTLASNGRVALEQMQRHRFALVITDHHMPEMTGVELCQRIRNLGHDREVPVILLTAKALDLEVRALGEELGVAKTFGKPFSPTAIVQSVKQLLSQVG